MKIAIFSDNFYPEISGISDSCLLNGKALAQRGHEIHFFVPTYSDADYHLVNALRNEPELNQNAMVHRLPSLPFYSTPTLQGRFVPINPFSRLLSGEGFDIIHSHTNFGAGLLALCLSKHYHIPLVGTNHTLVEAYIEYFPVKGEIGKKLINRYYTWYYNHCDYVTTPNEFLVENMKSKGLFQPAISISNPIDPIFSLARASKNKLKNELNLPGFTILCVARLTPEKNIESLVDAFIHFAPSDKKTRLVLIGQGSLYKKFKKQAEDANLIDQILFKGPYMGTNMQTLSDFFYASDLFIMPSKSETQSMTTLQAMAAGLPIIAAKAGAFPNLIGSEYGLLYDPSNTHELVQLIDRVYRHPQIVKDYVEKAIAFSQKLSPEAISHQWEELYSQTIEKHEFPLAA